jgi:hypothetical protein
VASIGRVTGLVNEIAAASQEQSAGIEHINQAIGQIDEVTQRNLALVEEGAAASRSLHDRAGSLAHVVSVFKLEPAGSVTADPHKRAGAARRPAPRIAAPVAVAV